MKLKELQNLPNHPLVGRALGAIRWADGWAPFAPRFVELALTYRCNLSCAFCYQDQSRRTDLPDLSFDAIRAIERNLSASFRWKPTVYLFGGEATIHPDFARTFQHYTDRGYRLMLTTNGAQLHRFVDELAPSRSLQRLVLSVNTLDFDRFHDVLNALHERCPRYEISLSCPVDLPWGAGLSLDDVARRFEHARASSLTFQHSQTVFLHDRRYDLEDLVRQVEEVERRRYGLPVLFFPRVRRADLGAYYSEPSFPGASRKCVLPWIDLFIRPNGDVTPCDEVDVVVGNAFHDSLRAIWNGPPLRSFRQRIHRDGNSERFCSRCCHRQYY